MLWPWMLRFHSRQFNISSLLWYQLSYHLKCKQKLTLCLNYKFCESCNMAVDSGLELQEVTECFFVKDKEVSLHNQDMNQSMFILCARNSCVFTTYLSSSWELILELLYSIIQGMESVLRYFEGPCSFLLRLIMLSKRSFVHWLGMQRRNLRCPMSWACYLLKCRMKLFSIKWTVLVNDQKCLYFVNWNTMTQLNEAVNGERTYI